VSASALKVAEAVLRKTQLALRQEVLKRESSLEVPVGGWGWGLGVTQNGQHTKNY